MQEEITGILEQWWYHPFYNVVSGRIFNDVKGRFQDATVIHTSDIGDQKDKLQEGYVVTTLNSTYKLGKPEFTV